LRLLFISLAEPVWHKIIVIGKRWLIASDEEGRGRLDNPDDLVRLEIATALKRNIRVIPLLVVGALMPRSTDLPDDLKLMVWRNALDVSHTRFNADLERLRAALASVLEKAEVEQRQRRLRLRWEVAINKDGSAAAQKLYYPRLRQ
jgi:hypothetical protein